MSVDIEQFAGKRVFVTGHTGFKGSWLTSLLTQAKAEVTGYSLPATPEKCHFNLLELAGDINHIEGDVRDRSKLEKAIADCKPEIIFHLAAQPIVRTSYEDPVATFETNVMGGWNLLEAVRQSDGIRALVFITSDKCYENVNWVWGYRETDQLGGHDPYSASKGAAEVVFSSYMRSFFEQREELGTATVRAGNVIGGGDWADARIVPDCVRAIAANEPIVLRYPSATRPWQHVLEPLSGYLTTAIKLLEDPKKFSGAWNFGPHAGDVSTVLDLAEAMVKHLGKGEIIAETPPANQYEAQLLQLNCDKAQQLMGWKPRWSAAEAIEATAVWYNEVVLQDKPAKDVTKRQIEEFFQA